jgi:hypothetical protein
VLRPPAGQKIKNASPVTNMSLVQDIANRRTRFHCKCGCIPGMQTAAPQAGCKWLTHWTSETVYWSEAARSPQGSPPATWPELLPVSVLQGGGGPLRSWMEPGKACDVWACRLFTLSARRLVKNPLKCSKAVSFSNHWLGALWSSHWRATKLVIESCSVTNVASHR